MPGRGDSRIAQLHDLGQSPWFDYISRELIARGGLKRMVDRDGLGGVTSNQAIFEKAMRSGSAYDEQILELARQGLSSSEIVDPFEGFIPRVIGPDRRRRGPNGACRLM